MPEIKNNPGLTDILRGYNEGFINGNNYPERFEQAPTFVRMIVMDVISDPNSVIDDKKIASFASMGVANMNYVNVLPRNTIIAKKVNDDSPPMFIFPFFPSHLSFPCKPGEMVWVMFEIPGSSFSDIAYWFCRVTEPHHVDDVNHSHPGRHFEISMFPGSKERFKNEESGKSDTGENVWHELRNGPVIKRGDDRETVHTNVILRGEEEDVFEKLITESDASKLMVYESVPRYRKRPGDIVLEGSNNTLISLGTDRGSGLVSNYIDPENDKEKITRQKVPALPTEDLRESSGTIDIVAGRGQINETYGKSAETTSIKGIGPGTKGPVLKEELNKSPDSLSAREGDPDIRNDRSRILVSQRTSVDTNLAIDSYNDSNFGVSDDITGDPAIIIKTDKLRLVARSDIEILVTSYEKNPVTAPNGYLRRDESNDSNMWASIVIKSNGDIIMKPSDEGYIKLGGDDANLGIVCSDTAVVADGGTVTGTAITTTMGGQFAGAVLKNPGSKNNSALRPNQGKFASKVLIK